MQGYALGNDATAATVLRMGEINLDGNVIPHSWYDHLRYPNGKPHLTAIVILSEIVYWYRPITPKDERTGRVLPQRKKFEGEYLQRTRASFSEQFGLTKKQAKDALAFLAEKGIIQVIVTPKLKLANGKSLGNVPYIALDAEKVALLNQPLVPVSPTLGTCKSEGLVPTSPTNTETTYTETMNTKRPLRANDARAEPPQASLFTDIPPVLVQKPTPPQKQPTPKAPPDTQRMTEYIVLEWGVDSYARAGNIVKTLQGRLPKGHAHHAYNLSPPVTLEELEEFTIDYYPKACKGCSFPRSPEKIQDHFYSMRRERTNSDIPPGYIMTGTGLQEVCW